MVTVVQVPLSLHGGVQLPGVEPSTRNGLKQIEGDADEDVKAGSSVAIQLPQLFHLARVWGPADRRRNPQTATHVSAQDIATPGGRPCITNVPQRSAVK